MGFRNLTSDIFVISGCVMLGKSEQKVVEKEAGSDSHASNGTRPNKTAKLAKQNGVDEEVRSLWPSLDVVILLSWLELLYSRLGFQLFILKKL